MLVALAALTACATQKERPVNSGPAGSAIRATAPVDAPRVPITHGAASAEGRATNVAAEPVPRAVELESQEPLPHYPFDIVHSPITPSVAQQIRQVALSHPERKADRFSKVGDSITRSTKFLTCLAGVDSVQLDAAERETLKQLRAARFDSIGRESSSAENGWSAWQPLAGQPPPLFRELSEAQGLFTFVLLGTNDIETSRVTTFARRFTKLIDATLARGSVPLVSTIPERHDRELSRLKVPRFNAAIRAIAQARRVPLIDLHLALSRLPNEGLASDGIHPSVFSAAGKVRACDFGPEGMRQGFNVRNWISLEALARARGVLDAAWTAEPEAAPAVSVVDGRLRIAELPFVEVRALTSEPPSVTACSRAHTGAAGDPAPVLRYDLSLTKPAFLEVLALSSATAESLAIELASASEPARCLALGSGFTRTSLARGDYSVTVRGNVPAAMVGVLLGRSGAS